MHNPQVPKEHYLRKSYDSKDRWVSYWYQVDNILKFSPHNVLEIGPGNKTAAEAIKKRGISITTVDIAGDLNPDVVASVTSLPFADAYFDGVSACEVLEHLPFSEFERALKEIHRVSNRFAVLSLPHAGYVFSFEFKLPLLKKKQIIWKLPFFWQDHKFNGEHYWELGKKGYAVSEIKKKIESCGFFVKEARLNADDPAHYFFLLGKI